MHGQKVAAWILIAVGLLNILYGIYRVMALDQSLLPAVPLGLMCAGLGVVLLIRSRSG